jgi:hypothetical protein
MAYKSIIVKLLKELEEDTVITNPKGQGRALLRRLVYRFALRISKIKERFSRTGRSGSSD